MLLNHFLNFSSIVTFWSPNPQAEPANIELIPLRLQRSAQSMPSSSALITGRSPVKKPPTELLANIIHAEENPALLQKAVQRIQKGDLDLNGTDEQGQTPVNLAAKGGHLNLVKTLIEQKVELNKPSVFKRTPLHSAASKSTPDIALALLAAGVQDSINQEDCIGRSPLHYAAWHGHPKTVESLLNNGANPNSLDTSRRTPLDYTLREINNESPLLNNQLKTLKLLLNHHAKSGYVLEPDNRNGKPDQHTVDTLSTILSYVCDQPKQDIELITLLLQQPFVKHPDEAQEPSQEPIETESYKNYRKAVAEIARRRKIFPFYREYSLKRSAPSSDHKPSGVSS